MGRNEDNSCKLPVLIASGNHEWVILQVLKPQLYKPLSKTSKKRNGKRRETVRTNSIIRSTSIIRPFMQIGFFCQLSKCMWYLQIATKLHSPGGDWYNSLTRELTLALVVSTHRLAAETSDRGNISKEEEEELSNKAILENLGESWGWEKVVNWDANISSDSRQQVSSRNISLWVLSLSFSV